LLNDIVMNEKNHDVPSVVMDLGLSHHYAQIYWNLQNDT